jgi:hypothetical protein
MLANEILMYTDLHSKYLYHIIVYATSIRDTRSSSPGKRKKTSKLAVYQPKSNHQAPDRSNLICFEPLPTKEELASKFTDISELIFATSCGFGFLFPDKIIDM